MLLNKIAIITGSNKGIGKATLKNFLNNDAYVIACVRKYRKSELGEIVDEYKDKISIIEFDFNNINEVVESANKITKENKSIDILVNNAGVIQTSLFQMTKIDEMKNLFDINFFNQLAFTQIIIKKMIRNKYSSIINISSNSALDSYEGRLAYSASKSAMISASRTLSKELGRFKLKVNCIAPGLTDTLLMNQSHKPEVIEEVIKNTSLNKIAQTEDIADTILFLASSMSNHITGEVIRVDGGL